MALDRLATIDISGPTAEILAWVESGVASERLLCSVNPMWNTLDLFRVEQFEPPVLTPLPDFDPARLGIQGLPLPGSPTSVAAHPSQPLVLVTVLGRGCAALGRIVGFDMRRETLGAVILDQPVGHHPDALAISADGRWAIVANEAEGNPEIAGSITILDIRGLRADRRATDGPLPAMELGPFGALLGTEDGEVEPEFVAIDRRSRFALVTCQENDAVLAVDLRREPPEVAGVLRLPVGAEPDGVSILDEVPGPDGRLGCLVAVGEEGRFDPYQQRFLGNCVSFWWIDPDALHEARMLSRVDVRPFVGQGNPEARRDPEGVLLLRLGEPPHARAVCLVVIERGDRLLCLDVTDPIKPVLAARARTGSRPEGVIAVAKDAGTSYILTGDEGNDGPGEITFLKLVVGAEAAVQADSGP